MAKIDRKNQIMFGNSAGVDEIAQYGSFAQGTPIYSTDPEVIQALSQFTDGWFTAIVGDNVATIEDTNALFYLTFYQLCYMFQSGIPEWNDDTTYYEHSFCSSGGRIYVSLQDDNLNNAVTDTDWWLPIGGDRTTQDRGTTFAYSPSVSMYTVHGNITATMPDADDFEGFEFILVKTDSNATTVAIAFVGGQTGSGQASLSLTEQWSFYRLKVSGGEFYIVGAG